MQSHFVFLLILAPKYFLEKEKLSALKERSFLSFASSLHFLNRAKKRMNKLFSIN